MPDRRCLEHAPQDLIPYLIFIFVLFGLIHRKPAFVLPIKGGGLRPTKVNSTSNHRRSPKGPNRVPARLDHPSSKTSSPPHKELRASCAATRRLGSSKPSLPALTSVGPNHGTMKPRFPDIRKSLFVYTTITEVRLIQRLFHFTTQNAACHAPFTPSVSGTSSI